MVSYIEEDNDEQYDDPISLLDFEQRRVVDINKIGATIEDPGCILEESSDSCSETEEYESSYGKRSLTLPVTFFDVRRNISLLKKCRPLSIKIVDCDIYPWYYKKQRDTNKNVVELDEEEDEEENLDIHTDLIVLPGLSENYQKSITEITKVVSRSSDQTFETQNYSQANQSTFIKGDQGINYECDPKLCKIIILEDDNSIDNKPVGTCERLVTEANDDISRPDKLFSIDNKKHFTETFSQPDVILPPKLQAKYDALKRKLSVDNKIINLIDDGVKERSSSLKTLLSQNNSESVVNRPSLDHGSSNNINTNNNIGPNELQVYKEIAKSIIRNVNYDEVNTKKGVDSKPIANTKSSGYEDNVLTCLERDGSSKETKIDKARENLTRSPLLPCNITPRKKNKPRKRKPKAKRKTFVQGVEESRKPCEQVMHTANKVIPHYHTINQVAAKSNNVDANRTSCEMIADNAHASYPELNKALNRNLKANYKNYTNKANETITYYQNAFEAPSNLARTTTIDNDVFGTSNPVSRANNNHYLLNNSFQSPFTNTSYNLQNNYQSPNSLEHRPVFYSQANCPQAVPGQTKNYVLSGRSEQMCTMNDYKRQQTGAYGNKEGSQQQATSIPNAVPRSVPSFYSSQFTTPSMQQVPLSNRQTANHYYNNDPTLNQNKNYMASHVNPPGYYVPVTHFNQQRLPACNLPNTRHANPNMKITSNRINYNMDHYLWWSHIFPRLSLPSPENKGPMDTVQSNIGNNSGINKVSVITKVPPRKSLGLESSNGAGLKKSVNLQNVIKNINDMSREQMVLDNKSASTHSKQQVNNGLQKSRKTLVKSTVENELDKQEPTKIVQNNLTTETANLVQNNINLTSKIVPPLKDYSPPILPILSFQATYEYFKKMHRESHNINSNNPSDEVSDKSTSRKSNNTKCYENIANRKRKVVLDVRHAPKIKKISLQDYKNRMLENGKMEVNGTCHKGDDSKSTRYNKGIVNLTDIQDQGYDSDSTVVLDVID